MRVCSIFLLFQLLNNQQSIQVALLVIVYLINLSQNTMGHLGSVIVLLLLVGGVVGVESQIFADYIVDENQSFNNRSTLISVSNVYYMTICLSDTTPSYGA